MMQEYQSIDYIIILKLNSFNNFWYHHSDKKRALFSVEKINRFGYNNIKTNKKIYSNKSSIFFIFDRRLAQKIMISLQNTCVIHGVFFYFQRFINTMSKGAGMLVIPNFPSNDGRHSGFSGFISNFCSNLVKNRKSSIFASESPKHNLRPVKVKKNNTKIRRYFKTLKLVDIIDMC